MHLWLQITLQWNARFTKAWWNHPPNLNTTRTSQQPARGFTRKTRLLKSLATMQHKLAKPCKMHLWLQITLSWNAHSTTTWWNRPRTVNKARNLETACQIYQWQTLPSLRISSLADSTSWRLKGPAVFSFVFLFLHQNIATHSNFCPMSAKFCKKKKLNFEWKNA